MVESLREKLNEAPPWVGYSVAGVLLVVAVGGAAWQFRSRDGGGPRGETHFLCRECDHCFTVSGDKAQQLLEEADKASQGLQRFVKCPECGERGCVICECCPECGFYYIIPPPEGGIPDEEFRDECPDCGFSAERERQKGSDR